MIVLSRSKNAAVGAAVGDRSTSREYGWRCGAAWHVRRPQVRPPSTDRSPVPARPRPCASLLDMGLVLGVVGGSGGVGASSFAAVLAATAGRSLLVDLDVAGGGLDVVLGIEAEAGARWSGLHLAGGR